MTEPKPKIVRFRQGDYIFREGDLPGAVYIIEKGIVEISKGVGADKIIIAEKKAGDVFGEMAMVDNQPRSATTRAITDLEVYVISEALFASFLKELNPIIYTVFRSLVANIREMNETQILLTNVLKLRCKMS